MILTFLISLTSIVKMTNREFKKELEARTLKFSFNVLRYSAKVQKCAESTVVRNQLCKSATSVGANYREANRARSKADFKNTLKICESEASETLYWLELISLFDNTNSDELRNLQIESRKLLALIAKCCRSN